MEVAALVCNDNLDYESALQAYSIFCFERKNGNQIQIVDYNLLDDNIKNFALKRKNALLYNFLDNNTILTAKRYMTSQQLENNIPLADEYVVLNAKQKDLELFPKEESVIYGVKELSKDEINLVKDDYKKFSTLFDSKDTQIKKVVDPLFLLSRDEWIDFSENSIFSQKNNNYILVYAKIVTKDMLEYARLLSEKYNSKIYIVADKIKSTIYKGKKLNNILPSDLVRLIINSNSVITSCNDGIKLSALFEKSLHIFKDNEDNHQIEVINELQLLDRIVNSPDKIIMKEITVTDLYKKIDENRANSIEFLK